MSSLFSDLKVGRFVSSGLIAGLTLLAQGAQAAPITAVTLGSYHNSALNNAGGVKCWGQNLSGQLGDNTTTTRTSAVDVVGLASGVTAIAAGGTFTCALTIEPKVKCWGHGDRGQLGNGNFGNSPVPVDVSAPVGAIQPSYPVAIAAATRHACMFTGAGQVFCWGDNTNGQLSNASPTTRFSLPGPVRGNSGGQPLANVTSIAAGSGHMCVTTTAGNVKCFGFNNYGQLGSGSTVAVNYAVDVPALGGTVLGFSAGTGHTCVLVSAVGAKCWGDNQVWETGVIGGATLVPRLVPSTAAMTSISNGANNNATVCTYNPNGGATCWGRNSYGNVGAGVVTLRATPSNHLFNATGSMAVVTAGPNTSCGISNGVLTCWGSNNYGQVGAGYSGSATILAPTAVLGL